MIFDKKKLVLIFSLFLLLLIGFENYKGINSYYIIVYEYLANENIFIQNDWTFYIQNHLRYLPLRILDFTNLQINNDFHLFSIYFLGGLISIYYLNKIILEFFSIKDFYNRFTIIFCTAFANFIIFKSIWSSSFIPYLNFQTSLVTQLLYPFFYMILSKRYFTASIISSFMIFTHFTVGWLPTLIFSIFLIFKTKFKNLKILYLIFPLTTFFLMYYININAFLNNHQDEIKIIELILNRSEEESVIALQPLNRIFYFLTSIFIFYYLQKKVIEKNSDLNLFFSITFYLTIFVIFFGFIWTSFGYKYLSFTPFAYLYFSRSILTYHILFLLLITYFIYLSNLSSIRKITLFIIIYTLGKTYLSYKGIIISSIFFLISIIIEKFINKKFHQIFASSRFALLVLFSYIFLTQIYLIKKNNLDHIDDWSLKYLNDWTQYNKFFLQKDDKYKNQIFGLRNCDDFKLIPIIIFNDDIRYENYINVVSHKSMYITDSALLYEDYDMYKINKIKIRTIENFIKNLKEQNDIKLILNSKNFENSAFLFDNDIYKKYFSNLNKDLHQNFIRLSNKLIFYSNNHDIKKKLESCILN